MKKKGFQTILYGMALTAFQFLGTHCKAQDVFRKNINYDIDFNKINDFFNTHTGKIRIRGGKIVTLNITNINKDLFTVTVTPSNTSNNIKIPDALKLSAFIFPGSIVPGAVKAQYQYMMAQRNPRPNPAVLSACAQEAARLVQIIDDSFASISTEVKEINKIILFNNQMQSLQKECGISFAEVKTRLQTYADGALGSHADLPELIKTTYRKHFDLLKNEYASLQKNLTKLDENANSAACIPEKLPGLTERMKDVLGKVDDLYSTIDDFNQGNKIDAVIALYNSFNAGNYTVTSSDTAKKADIINFTINVVSKNWTPCTPVNKQYSLNLNVVRWKVDFSTGIFINGGGKNFRPANYFIDSNKKIAQLSASDKTFVPSIGALMHIYHNNGGLFNGGLVLGASLANDIKYSNLHAGLGIMFNSNNEIWNRVALSGGLTMRYVTTLSKDYKVGDSVDASATIDLVEVAKFTPGWFFCLSYNLTSH